jgi:hypothetical protein
VVDPAEQRLDSRREPSMPRTSRGRDPVWPVTIGIGAAVIHWQGRFSPATGAARVVAASLWAPSPEGYTTRRHRKAHGGADRRQSFMWSTNLAALTWSPASSTRLQLLASERRIGSVVSVDENCLNPNSCLSR